MFENVNPTGPAESVCVKLLPTQAKVDEFTGQSIKDLDFFPVYFY